MRCIQTESTVCEYIRVYAAYATESKGGKEGVDVEEIAAYFNWPIVKFGHRLHFSVIAVAVSSALAIDVLVERLSNVGGKVVAVLQLQKNILYINVTNKRVQVNSELYK